MFTRGNIGHTIVSLGLVFLLSSGTVSSGELEPYENKSNADFSLPDLDGNIHTLQEYNGKVVLVNFWASWCIPCIMEMPELTQLKQHMTSAPYDKQSFEILAINVGEYENSVKQFARRTKLDLPVLVDESSKAFDAWNARAMPTSFLVDAHGTIRYRANGNPGWIDEEIFSLIGDLIKETENTAHAKQ